MAVSIPMTVAGTPAVGNGTAANQWRSDMSAAITAKRAELGAALVDFVGVDVRFGVAGPVDQTFTRTGPAVARLTADFVELLVPDLIDEFGSIVALKAQKVQTTGPTGLRAVFITRD